MYRFKKQVKVLSLKLWKVLDLNKQNAVNISNKYNIPIFTAMLLDIYKVSNIEDYINLDYEKFKYVNFTDMQKAVDRIKKAINNFEKICICGDYDADGVTATALLYSYLEGLGANVIYHIPKRHEDGYGLNTNIIDELKSEDVNLIVTVDNGICAVKEISYAKTLGIDVVVTDHHRLPEELPEAVAIVDPQREKNNEHKNLAGVGVAFKLIVALEEDADIGFLLEEYAELVAIGTIGDIVPLQGENRIIAKVGLEFLNQTNKVGLIALLKEAGIFEKYITSTDVAFGIVPRINAAGRLSTTDKVVELLTCEDEEKAQCIARNLEKENSERKALGKEAFEQIEVILKKEPERLFEKVIIVDGANWHPGVIGIVASKLVERYSKPAIVITRTENVARASARSIEGFSIYDAINSCSSYLVKFGGHTMAAGFDINISDIERFRNDIRAFTANVEMPFQTLNITCKLNPEMLSLDVVEQIGILEPFGKDNPQPIFGLYKMKLEKITPVGNGNHLRLTFSRDNKKIVAMKFFMTENEFPYRAGEILDLAVTVSKSLYNGSESLSIIINDMKFSDFNPENLLIQKRTYEKIKRGETKDGILSEVVPSRDDIAMVYKLLKQRKVDEETINIEISGARFQKIGINFCKLLLIFDIMEELKLINIEREPLLFKVHVNKMENKIDINSSVILKELKRQVI